jgi:signal transduction histidine kinase
VLLAMVSIAIVTVIVLGVPLAIFGRLAVQRDAAVRADKEADSIAVALADHLAADGDLSAASLERFASGGRYLVITDRNGRTTTIGTRPTDDATVADIDTTDGSHIQLFVPDNDVDHDEALVLMTVAGLAAVAVLAALGLGIVLSRRLTRPLDAVTDVARRLGTGDFAVRAPATGVAEIDTLGSAMNDGAARIGRLIAAEREFSANASHQLRTPLTAVRMRLEEIEAQGDDVVRAEATAALGQVDRLDATIGDLLRLAREGSATPAAPVDLTAIARRHADTWEQLARRDRRRVVLVAPGAPVWAYANAGAAGHALDILVENGLRHGDGTVTISVHRDADVATIDVTDEGPGIRPGSEAEIFRRGVTADSSGIGLALAADLVAADHGRLTLLSPAPARFRMTYRADGHADEED